MQDPVGLVIAVHLADAWTSAAFFRYSQKSVLDMAPVSLRSKELIATYISSIIPDVPLDLEVWPTVTGDLTLFFDESKEVFRVDAASVILRTEGKSKV